MRVDKKRIRKNCGFFLINSLAHLFQEQKNREREKKYKIYKAKNTEKNSKRNQIETLH